jgi:hypothetical protein
VTNPLSSTNKSSMFMRAEKDLAVRELLGDLLVGTL